MPESGDPELEWIRQIAAGDREAFENLHAAYRTRLFRYLARLVGEKGLAEELTNDALVAAWKGAASFKGQSKTSTWLFSIARHKALNALRGRQHVTVEIESAMAVAASSENPEQSVSRDQRHTALRQALGELSLEHREVVELTFYHGLSYQEIAEIMACPVNTVKTRMFYARKRLQEILEQRGIYGEIL